MTVGELLQKLCDLTEENPKHLDLHVFVEGSEWTHEATGEMRVSADWTDHDPIGARLVSALTILTGTGVADQLDERIATH